MTTTHLTDITGTILAALGGPGPAPLPPYVPGTTYDPASLSPDAQAEPVDAEGNLKPVPVQEDVGIGTPRTSADEVAALALDLAAIKRQLKRGGLDAQVRADLKVQREALAEQLRAIEAELAAGPTTITEEE